MHLTAESITFVLLETNFVSEFEHVLKFKVCYWNSAYQSDSTEH